MVTIYKKYKTMLVLIIISTLMTGFIAGKLWERYKYYKKTGKHLQDI